MIINFFRQKSRKAPTIAPSSRLQSEEDLILNLQRKQEFKAMNQQKIKVESEILQNIRKREMIDKINRGAVEKRQKEEKKKIHEQFGIASGLMQTKNLLLAPITTINESESDLIDTEEKETKALPRYKFNHNKPSGA